MNFDQIIDCRNTHSSKWDMMQKYYGVSPEDGLAMWVAVADFQTAPPVLNLIRKKSEHGVFGYFGDDRDYLAATQWWMKNRHDWEINQDWIVTTCGLGNALAMTIDVFSKPGEGVIVFSPAYHAFASKIHNAERVLVECQMVNDDGYYRLDFDAYDQQMTGNEKLIFLSSPHNPGGRVWTKQELKDLAAFAQRHDLILVSDEVHHDLIYPGAEHIPTAIAVPEITDRLVTLTAASKTFNLAGLRTGNIIVQDEDLRRRLATRIRNLDIKPSSLGFEMTTAAYSPEGAVWVDAQVAYLDGNRRLLDEGLNAIPGVKSMPLQATFLAWVDFSGTGMAIDEITRRVTQEANIAPDFGTPFGRGGEQFLRLNFGLARSRIEDAVTRLQAAFADLQ